LNEIYIIVTDVSVRVIQCIFPKRLALRIAFSLFFYLRSDIVIFKTD